MYHSLAGNGAKKASAQQVIVSLQAFKAQMDWLYKEGYKTISNGAFMRYLSEGKEPMDKCVQLTFDDGYHSWYLDARDILAQYGFRATIFLSTAYVERSYNMPDFVTHDRPLTWTEVKELAASGWSVQAHGHRHPRWTHIPLSEVRKELHICRREIEQNLGIPVNRVAYPYGAYSREILNCLSEEGYEAAYSVHTGKAYPTSDKLRIPRIEINSLDTMSSFQRKVRTGYISTRQEIRGKVRDLLFANPLVKDIIGAIG